MYLKKYNLKNKYALITGAGKGLGRACAIGLAEAGANLIILSRTEKDLKQVSQIAKRFKVKCKYYVCDVTKYSEIKSVINAQKRIDIVVNNAGILRDVIFHKMTEDDWDSVISVHLKGSFNVSRAAASVFREKESGAFIHMTSTSGLVGNFGQANYAAAKLGIAGLSKSIALDMGRFNVRSNCISPFAWSRMIGTIPIGDDAQRARVEKLKTMTTAKIAPVAVALCAPESKVTGQIFGVRNNEIFLMGQSRPIRSVHRGEGWTPETVLEHAIPSMEPSFYPLDRSQDVFSWDPI